MLNTDQNDASLHALTAAFLDDPAGFCRVQAELLSQYRIAKASETIQNAEMTSVLQAIQSVRLRMGQIPSGLIERQNVFRSTMDNRVQYREFFDLWELIENDVMQIREKCSRLIALSLSVQDAYRRMSVCESSCRAVAGLAKNLQNLTFEIAPFDLVAQATEECKRLEAIAKRLRDQVSQLRDFDTRFLHRVFEEVWKLADVLHDGAAFDREAILMLLDSAEKEIGTYIEQIGDI